MGESKIYKSPTGSLIIGTLETTPCRCEIHGINEDGSPDYAGESKMFWDDTRPIMRDNKILYLDEDGSEWTFDQLSVAVEEEA